MASEITDEQIIAAAYQHLPVWDQDHIRFARAVLALASHTGEAEPVADARTLKTHARNLRSDSVAAKQLHDHLQAMAEEIEILAYATPPAATPAAPGEVTASERYHWLVENFDVRSLVGVGDLTKLDTFIDGKIYDKRGLVLSRAASGGGVGSDPLAVGALSNPAPVAAPASEQETAKPVLCVSSKEFKRMRAGDDSIKAWLPPTTSAEDMPLYAAPIAAPAPASEAVADEKLTVWFGSMPESNGKENWTAILYRQSGSLLGGIEDGFTLARSEYHDRVRYDADMMRYLLGELPERPDILAYDGDMKSSAGDSADAPVQQAETANTERLAFLQQHRVALIPEYEGPWDAEIYGESEAPIARGSGNTPHAAIDDARAALKGEQPVEPSGSERGEVPND